MGGAKAHDRGLGRRVGRPALVGPALFLLRVFRGSGRHRQLDGVRPGTAFCTVVVAVKVTRAHPHLVRGPLFQVAHRVGPLRREGVAPLDGVLVLVGGPLGGGLLPGDPVVGGRPAGSVPRDDQLSGVGAGHRDAGHLVVGGMDRGACVEEERDGQQQGGNQDQPHHPCIYRQWLHSSP